MRVIGIDPGTVATGWGVVDEGRDGRPRFVAGGVIRPRGELPARLAFIQTQMAAILTTHQPAAASIEKPFVGDNVQSAFRLGEARGALLVACAQAGLVIAEYAPAAIKLAVAGAGRAAKDQMQRMVAHILGLDAELPSDEADALAAALCHLQSYRFAALVDGNDALPADLFRRRRKGRLR